MDSLTSLKFMVFSTMLPLLSAGSFIPVILYVVARWRASKDAAVDPQLGLKFAIYYFGTVALHVALVGLTLVIYTIVRPSDPDGDGKGEAYRMAFGFLLPAAAVFGGHLALLLRTNDRVMPGVKRLFYGFNLLVAGLLGFTALVASCQALFHKGSTDGMGHFAGAALVVYGTLWGLLAWRFDRLVVGPPPGTGYGEVPRHVVPPPAPVPVSPLAVDAPSPYAPPRATPVGELPELGGGAYPPIDPDPTNPTRR